jgi:hypothetical protein
VDHAAGTPEVRLYPGPFTPDRQSHQRHLLTGLFRTYHQPLSFIPSMPPLRSEETSDTATSFTTASGRHDTASSLVFKTGWSVTTALRDPSSAKDTRHLSVPLAHSTIVPPAVSSLRPPSAGPSASAPSSTQEVGDLLVPHCAKCPCKDPVQTVPRDTESTIYSPEDDGPVRRVRPGKASSVYSLSNVNGQGRHRLAAEDSSKVD